MELYNFSDNIIVMIKRKKTNIYLLLFFILLFRTSFSFYTFNYKYKEWKNEKREITVINVEKVEDDSITYIGILGIDKVIFSVKDVDDIYSFGDKIAVICSNYSIERLGNPYEFNYKRYLNSKNIALRINVSKVVNIQKNTNVIIKIRERIRSTLDSSLGDYSNIAKSLMYGDDIYLDESFKTKCKNIGIGHMMCISGAHVMFLSLAFENIIGDKRKNKYVLLLNILLILYFYIISLFELSLLRVVIICILNVLFPKKSYYFKLILCIYIILLINPYYVFNVGLIFSILSIVSIRVFNPVISSFFKVKLKLKNEYFLSNISLSISSLVLIMPFQIYYFGIVCPISVFSNIVLSFVLSVLMQFIFYAFIFIFISVISQIFLKIVYLLLHLFVLEVDFLDKINCFNISIPKINIWIFILYYCSLLVLMNKSRIAIVYFWQYRKITKCLMDVIVIAFVLYFSIWYVYTMYFDSYVIYFNVGQGNMCLIHKGVTNIVVDCGSTRENLASYVLTSFLKAKNIDSIDLILITHMHKDHMNGIEGIIYSGINIKRVGYSLPCENVEEFINLKQLLKKEKIGIICLSQLDNIRINSTNITCFTPPKDYYLKDKDMLNANSSVYLVKDKEKRLLFMGDSTKVTEKYLLNNFFKELKDIDIYQVSHHGSKTSSLKDFVTSINISNAVISSQKAMYGHPDDEVLELFKNLKITTYITEKKGAIIF